MSNLTLKQAIHILKVLDLNKVKKDFLKEPTESQENRYESFVSLFTYDSTAIEGNTLTESQITAIDSIVNDLKRGYPMSRLLEGDVGSGKTAVAATIIYTVTRARPVGKNYGNLQTAYMAPTEILAKQHY